MFLYNLQVPVLTRFWISYYINCTSCNDCLQIISGNYTNTRILIKLNRVSYISFDENYIKTQI